MASDLLSIAGLLVVIVVVADVACALPSSWTDDFKDWTDDKILTDSVSGKRYHGEFATDSVISHPFQCITLPSAQQPQGDIFVTVSYKLGLCPGLYFVDYSNDFVAVYTGYAPSMQARQSLVHVYDRASDVLDTTGLDIECNHGAMEYEVPRAVVLPTTADGDTLFIEMALSYLAENVVIYDVVIECDENSRINVEEPEKEGSSLLAVLLDVMESHMLFLQGTNDEFAVDGYDVDRYRFNLFLIALLIAMICLNVLLWKYCCCGTRTRTEEVERRRQEPEPEVFSVRQKIYCDDF